MDESVSLTVVRAVAEAKGVEPMELDEQLHDCVDPDALDRLFESGADGQFWDGQLSFTMAGCRVDIEGRGTVVVTHTDASTASDTVTP